MTVITASAPGKLFLTGEYAVLDHGPALLSAVDIRARCSLRPSIDGMCRISTPPLSAAPAVFQLQDGELTWETEPVPLLAAVWAALEPDRRQMLSRQGWHVMLDTSAFFLKGCKLGVGSSAAASTSLMGALWVASGGLPRETDAFSQLKQVHDAWQGGGSGGDLAVVLAGGTILYRREPRIAAPVALPESVEILPVWTGESASTGEFLRRLNAFEQREPETFRSRFGVLVRASEEAALAASDGDHEMFCQAFSALAAALRALGDASGLPIWSATHETIGERVAAAGGLYKPSGAGGGDIGLALVPTGDAGAAESVKSSLSSAGYQVLPLRFGARGLVAGKS